MYLLARIEGRGGFVNLMRIKSNYYHKIEKLLKADIEKALEKYPEFKDELLTNFIPFSAATLQKAYQSVSNQRHFITLSMTRFIPMRKMSSFFGKRRCFIM